MTLRTTPSNGMYKNKKKIIRQKTGKMCFLFWSVPKKTRKVCAYKRNKYLKQNKEK